MAREFLMPKLGLTMEEGTIIRWLVDDGDLVVAGTPALLIETDKTETEVETSAAGHVHRIATEGGTYSCGELIGWFLDDGEMPPAAIPAVTPTTVEHRPPTSTTPVTADAIGDWSDGRLFASPNARRLARERGLDLRTVRGTGPGGRIVSEDLDGAVAPPPTAADRMAPFRAGPPGSRPAVPATFAARQLADLLGVDLAAVPIDPADGRVTREAVAIHVRHLLAATATTTAGEASPRLPAPSQAPTETIPLTGMRGTIAKRMHESLRQMAQLTLFMDAEMDAVVADRESRTSAGRAPSYTDYVIAAVARAVTAHPRVNSQVTDEGIAVLPDVHVGMAVALDDGLIVPVVRDTTSLDLASLAAETSRLAAAARAGSLRLPEIEGGTISVTTLGMFGVDGFTPVINPPNAAIVGVGRLRTELVPADDGRLVREVTRATISVTWDHRVLDGAPAAAFCRSICDELRQPDELDRARP